MMVCYKKICLFFLSDYCKGYKSIWIPYDIHMDINNPYGYEFMWIYVDAKIVFFSKTNCAFNNYKHIYKFIKVLLL